MAPPFESSVASYSGQNRQEPHEARTEIAPLEINPQLALARVFDDWIPGMCE